MSFLQSELNIVNSKVDIFRGINGVHVLSGTIVSSSAVVPAASLRRS